MNFKSQLQIWKSFGELGENLGILQLIPLKVATCPKWKESGEISFSKSDLKFSQAEREAENFKIQKLGENFLLRSWESLEISPENFEFQNSKSSEDFEFQKLGEKFSSEN